MTEEEHEQLQEAIEDIREDTQQYLADELGGEPEDYRFEEDDK